MRSTWETYCRSTSEGASPPRNHGPAVSPSASSTCFRVRSRPFSCESISPLPGWKVSWHHQRNSSRSSPSSFWARSRSGVSGGGTIGGPWSKVASSVCMIGRLSVMNCPSISMAGSSPLGTLRRKSAGLSP